MKKCPNGYTCRIQNVPFFSIECKNTDIITIQHTNRWLIFQFETKACRRYIIEIEMVWYSYLRSAPISNDSRKMFWTEAVNPIFILFTLLFGCHSQYESKMKEKILAICFHLNFRDISAVRDVLIQWIKIDDINWKRPEMCFLMKIAVTCQSDLLSITWTQNGIKPSSIAFFGVPTMLMSRPHWTTKCYKVVHDEFLFSIFIENVIAKCILFDAW